MNVYLVQHLSIIDNDTEDIKMIGIYSSKNESTQAIARIKNMPGFKDSPKIINPISDDEVEGFYIDEYTIDEDHWSEGFVTVR